MIAFIFPGQGAQYVGMGRDLYEAFPESRRIFDTADKVLNFPLSKLCFDGPIEELTQTVNCQPAIFTASIACLSAFNKLTTDNLQLTAKYMAGLSLGEYTALVAANALSFEDGLRLVSSRARFMDEAAGEKPGRMSSILGLDLDIIEKIAQESGTEIANLNCPGQVGLSGPPEAVDKANELALMRGAKRAINLEVSGAFHSSLMQSAAQKLAGIFNNIDIKEPGVAVISNVTALPESRPEEIKDNLIRQITHSVFWERSVRFMISEGVNKFFEIGPGRVLKGLIRKIDSNAEVTNIENKENILQITKKGGTGV
jgi:[acyl-carrier-protein] S-malonyltransferase